MADAKTVAQSYLDLQERLAKNPVGAPPADELFEIFQILFTEEEALVASRMPMRPATFDDVLSATGMDRDRLTALLDSMADKGLVIDVESRSEMRYILAPPVIGFMEYTFMKRNEHLPMKRLAELANSYISNHLSQEVAGSQTERTRVIPYESAFGEMVKEVLTYEKASEMIKDIRSYRLLQGVRGEQPSDVAAVADCLLRLSQLVTEHPCVKELDINPLMVYARGEGAMVADARIILSET